MREDVERKAAELRSSWGVGADEKSARVLNLSHYLALREHDLTDLQYRLAARGLSSLGRSEGQVALALETLIATLRRLTGEPGAPYPATAVGDCGRRRTGGGGQPAVRQAAEGRPAHAGDGDAPA